MVLHVWISGRREGTCGSPGRWATVGVRLCGGVDGRSLGRCATSGRSLGCVRRVLGARRVFGSRSSGGPGPVSRALAFDGAGSATPGAPVYAPSHLPAPLNPRPSKSRRPPGPRPSKSRRRPGPRPAESRRPPRASPAKLGARATQMQQRTTTRPPATARVGQPPAPRGPPREARTPLLPAADQTTRPNDGGPHPSGDPTVTVEPGGPPRAPGEAKPAPPNARARPTDFEPLDDPEPKKRRTCRSRRPQPNQRPDVAQRTRERAGGRRAPPQRPECTNGPGRQATEPVRVCSGRGAWALSTSRPFHRPASHHRRPARPPECPPPPLRW